MVIVVVLVVRVGFLVGHVHTVLLLNETIQWWSWSYLVSCLFFSFLFFSFYFVLFCLHICLGTLLVGIEKGEGD